MPTTHHTAHASLLEAYWLDTHYTAQREKRLCGATTVHQPTQTAQPTMLTHSRHQPRLKPLRRHLHSTHIYHTVHCAYITSLLRAYVLNNTALDANAKYDYTRWRKDHPPQTEQPTSPTQALPLPPLQTRRIPPPTTRIFHPLHCAYMPSLLRAY